MLSSGEYLEGWWVFHQFGFNIFYWFLYFVDVKERGDGSADLVKSMGDKHASVIRPAARYYSAIKGIITIHNELFLIALRNSSIDSLWANTLGLCDRCYGLWERKIYACKRRGWCRKWSVWQASPMLRLWNRMVLVSRIFYFVFGVNCYVSSSVYLMIYLSLQLPPGICVPSLVVLCDISLFRELLPQGS